MSCSFVNRVRVRLDAVDSELPVLALEETLVDEDVREKVGGIGEGKERKEGKRGCGCICNPDSVSEPNA